MKKVIRLTESDLARIIKRVIKEDEDFDYNAITEDFHKIRDVLINMANNGKFMLRVVDESNLTNDTYGENESFSNTKKKVFVKILQPTYMLIASVGTDRNFSRDFISLLSDKLRNLFPEMYVTASFENDYIAIKPKKYVEQGYYNK
jgi:hypothetical protein